MTPDRYQHLPSLTTGEETTLSREQSLQRLAETAEYVSQRALQLDEQVREAEQMVLHLSALARQLRTLSSNTTLEATRMRMSGPLAEIARQMRRISQQISESNDQLGMTLRGYTVATGELHQAATTLQGDARAIHDAPDEAASPPLQFMPPRPTPIPPRTGGADMLRRYRSQPGTAREDDRT
jgi:hypothetical protein